MVSLRVVGLNCGTSIDGRRPLGSITGRLLTPVANNTFLTTGIDVAHCRITSLPSSNDVEIELLSYTEVPVDPVLRSQVLRLCRPNSESAATSMSEVCDLNFALGREFSRAIEESGVDLSEVDIVASHGQTLWHQPLGEHRSTLQMGEPAVIAARTRKYVTNLSFCPSHMITGYQNSYVRVPRGGACCGASGCSSGWLLRGMPPFRPKDYENQSEYRRNRYAHTLILRHFSSSHIPNLGNASVLQASGQVKSQGESSPSTYLAFDTGPGNVFIDAAMRILTDGEKHYDRDGELGAKGEAEIDEDLVNEYLENEPYFQVKPPKTTGRELFSDDVARLLVKKLQALGKSPAATIATITRITAESIARAYESFVLPRLEGGNIDEIYICGGGAYNPNILKHLQTRFPQSKVMRLDGAENVAKLDASAKEAVMFALLGFLCVCGRVVPLAADAEDTTPAVMGVVTPGDNYREILRAVAQDSGFDNCEALGRIVMA